MKKVLIVLAVLAVLAGFGIYKLVGSFSKAGELGDAAVAKFHADYNANKPDVIHAAATPAFQKAVPLAQWTGMVSGMREGNGAWVSGERTGINMNNDNGNKILDLTFSAKFEKGSGTEVFTFDYNGDLPILLGYKYDPAAGSKPAAPPAESDKPANPPATNP